MAVKVNLRSEIGRFGLIVRVGGTVLNLRTTTLQKYEAVPRRARI